MRARTMWFLATAPLAIAQAAGAVEINTATTTPVRTSTANAGAPDDVTIAAAGAIRPTEAGAAVTVDSNNNATNAGTIEFNDVDDAVGIRGVGGNAGNITNSGSIRITETYNPADSDSDGDLDGAWAEGQRRVGILIEGADPFTGTVSNTGSIVIEGNNSAGIRTATNLVGDLTTTGSISVLGDNGVGLDIQRGATGAVTTGGSIVATGENSVAVSVQGDVGGALTLGGTIQASAYRELQRRNTDRELLDADDLLQAGPAAQIGGSVAGGVLISGPTDEDDTIPASTIFVGGGQPGVLISAGLDAARTADVVIGPTGEDAEGFINRGVVRAAGIHDGVAATAVAFEGASDGRRVIVQGGVRNDGRLESAAYAASAMGLHLRGGSETPIFTNTGLVTATSLTGDGTAEAAHAILIEEGASLTELVNSGAISAVVVSDTVGAYAIVDRAGMLTVLRNTGAISAAVAAATADVTATGPTVAIDVSANTTGVTFTQAQAEDDDPEDSVTPAAPQIVGDILFGSGADTFALEAGQVEGALAFGAGADRFEVSNGASYRGALTDTDGQLALVIANGQVAFTNTGALGLTELDLGADSRVTFRVDATGETIIATLIDVAGVANVAAGARFAPEFEGLLRGSAEFTVISADTLTLAGDISQQLATDVPFLYTTTLRQSDTDPNAVIMSVRTRTADELGLGSNDAAAYDAVLTAAEGDAELGSALASLMDQGTFSAAYRQLLPEYSAAPLQFAVAHLDGGIGAVANRLDTVRGGREGEAGVWVQEFATYQDREGGMSTPGFRGHGFGFALGFDRPMGPFYAAGVSLSGAASQFEEPGTFDQPLSVQSGQLGAYAAAAAGNLLFDVFVGGGLDRFESERNVTFGGLDRTTMADWGGTHVAGSARLAYELLNGNRMFVRPSVSVDFIRLTEDGYQEAGGGDGIDLIVAERTSEMFASTALLSFGANLGSRSSSWWSPRARVGYRNEFNSELPTTLVRFVSGQDSFNLTSPELDAGSVILGASLAAGSDYSSFSLDYDADIRSELVRHTGRASFRFIF